jgi:hypothetical protein
LRIIYKQQSPLIHGINGLIGELSSKKDAYFFFLRARPAKLARPIPKSNIVAGSGIGLISSMGGTSPGWLPFIGGKPFLL